MTFVFRSPSADHLGTFVVEIRELKPDKRARWRVTEGPAEWIGTDIEFDLKEEGGQTTLLFGHRNWKEPVEFMAQAA